MPYDRGRTHKTSEGSLTRLIGTSANFGILLFLLVGLMSCGESAPFGSNHQSNASGVPNREQLNTPTYDGSGQAMHPAIVVFPQDWHGYRYWMSVTPYTNDNVSVENPSILVSHDGITWIVPAGVSNPVAPYQSAHLMDSDLFYDAASDQLWVYYLRDATETILLRRTSSDGIHWSDATTLLSVPYIQIVSPAIAKVNGTYQLWSVNPGVNGCGAGTTQVEYRSSSDGVHWVSPHIVNLRQPGFEIWHIDVQWIAPKGEYWALYAAYPAGRTCGITSLYFATSTDGLNWNSFRKPLIAPGGGWDSGQIYRSTFIYDATSDSLDIWYSAQKGHVWHTGYYQVGVNDLDRSLE